MCSAYTPCPQVLTPSGGDSNADPIRPNFRCTLGLMHGYSQKDSRPTEKNMRALLRDLDGSLAYLYEGRDATWEEILEAIEKFPQFWCAYFDGSEWPKP